VDHCGSGYSSLLTICAVHVLKAGPWVTTSSPAFRCAVGRKSPKSRRKLPKVTEFIPNSEPTVILPKQPQALKSRGLTATQAKTQGLPTLPPLGVIQNELSVPSFCLLVICVDYLVSLDFIIKHLASWNSSLLEWKVRSTIFPQRRVRETLQDHSPADSSRSVDSKFNPRSGPAWIQVQHYAHCQRYHVMSGAGPWITSRCVDSFIIHYP